MPWRPDEVVPGDHGRTVAHRRLAVGDREHLLRVVYEEIGDEIIVITAYTTSKIGEYWRGQ
jgi:hypothetical protein